jgi:hypothetical protein
MAPAAAVVEVTAPPETPVLEDRVVLEPLYFGGKYDYY